MKGPRSNALVKVIRPWHGYGVDHRLFYPMTFALVEFNNIDPSMKRQAFLVEGLRSTERQKELRASGASQTSNSKHLIGLALDVLITIEGAVVHEVQPHYGVLWKLLQKWDADYNGQRLISWGGDWISLKDGGHFEL